MDVNQTSYCTVLDKNSQSKFICYTRRKNGAFNIRFLRQLLSRGVSSQNAGGKEITILGLTDAADVWSTEYTEDTLKEFRQKFALKSTEDYILKLRSACGSGDVSVVVRDSSAELRVGSSPTDLSVTLPRLDAPHASEELKELLFRMADGLAQPGSKCGSPSVSPVKNHQRRHTEFEPRQQQSCAPSVTVKKRLPGASLINPGTKKKRQATGVAFDDADD